MIIPRTGATAVLPLIDLPTTLLLSTADRLTLVELLQVAQVHLLQVAGDAISASPELIDRLRSWASASADLQDRIGHEVETLDPVVG